MDAILSYKKETADDYYHLLGCNESSSKDQIIAEYKVRALETHPDKNPSDPLADDRFKKLQMAKETLIDDEKRKTYDKWLNSGIAIPYEQWTALSKTGVQASFHWATRKNDGGTTAIEGLGGETSSKEDDGRNRRESRTEVPFGKWERETPDSTLRRFRNYEI